MTQKEVIDFYMEIMTAIQTEFNKSEFGLVELSKKISGDFISNSLTLSFPGPKQMTITFMEKK